MFNGGGLGMGFGGPIMVLFWVIVIIGGVVLVKWLVDQSSGSAKRGEKTPMDILRERYARGEIDRDEYEQKRKDLEGSE